MKTVTVITEHETKYGRMDGQTLLGILDRQPNHGSASHLGLVQVRSVSVGWVKSST